MQENKAYTEYSSEYVCVCIWTIEYLYSQKIYF